MKAACAVITIFLLISPFLIAEAKFYEVQENDTLYGISREFSVGVDDIMHFNDISDARSLKAGDRLLIPSVYVVQKGDTLYGIARRLNSTVDVLVDLNDFKNDYLLKSGESIFVPLTESLNDNMPEASDVLESTAGGTIEKAPESGMRVSADGMPFWPHEGDRIDRVGKLTGMEIIGEKGDDVYTIAGGEVVWSAPYRGYGKIIIIESVDKYLYLYGGNESVLVTIGQRVVAGTKIAKLGIDPHSGDARLFFGVYKDGEYIDPGSAPRG